MVNIDGVFDGAAIGAAGVISGKRAPTYDFVILDRNGDWMLSAVVSEPVMATFQRFQVLLIGAGGMNNVMIVDVVDGFEVGFQRGPDGDGR